MRCECGRELKINETRKRSLLKSIVLRIIEILIDFLILGFILRSLNFQDPFQLSLFLAILAETTCFLVSYLNERLWNLIQYGRKFIPKEK